MQDTAVLAKAVKPEKLPLSQPLVLFRLSIDWLRPTTLGRSIDFTQSVNANVDFIQKHPHRHTQDNI